MASRATFLPQVEIRLKSAIGDVLPEELMLLEALLPELMASMRNVQKPEVVQPDRGATTQSDDTTE